MEEILKKLQEIMESNLIDSVDIKIEKVGNLENTSIQIITKDQIKSIATNKESGSACVFDRKGMSIVNGSIKINVEDLAKELATTRTKSKEY